MRHAHSHFHGLQIGLRSLSGARALRVVHPAGQRIGEHRHEWPLLTIPALGGYVEDCDGTSVRIDGPAAVLHPAGRCHANCIHSLGMETLSIEFEPAWLRRRGRFEIDRSRFWIGGKVALAARALARAWADGSESEATLRCKTSDFVQMALHSQAAAAPPWLAEASRLASEDQPYSTESAARKLRLHAGWLAHAYRLAAGEGFHETVRRRRAERAVHMLRTSGQPLADVAAATGFCDQSHLNRVLRRLTGRTPLQIRAEGAELRRLRLA